MAKYLCVVDDELIHEWEEKIERAVKLFDAEMVSMRTCPDHDGGQKSRGPLPESDTEPSIL